jgi:hypothetical protein
MDASASRVIALVLMIGTVTFAADAARAEPWRESDGVPERASSLDGNAPREYTVDGISDAGNPEACDTTGLAVAPERCRPRWRRNSGTGPGRLLVIDGNGAGAGEVLPTHPTGEGLPGTLR